MNSRILKANFLLLLAATVWGTTFVAQRVGMDHLGPFSYTALRFGLGAVFLIPFAWRRRRKSNSATNGASNRWIPILGGLSAGLVMAIIINLQQIGLVYTTAGKAGFITGLYVIIVPMSGLIWGYRPSIGVWIGAVLGAAGLYFLSMSETLTLSPGDGWVLLCAFVCAVQIWGLGWLSPRMDSYVLAFSQAAICAVISLVIALLTETITWTFVLSAWLPIVWGGLLSVGLGFTLQVIGQKDSPPVQAAIILSLEAVIAAVGGRLFLDEHLGVRGVTGATLMFSGMLVSQLWDFFRKQPV